MLLLHILLALALLQFWGSQNPLHKDGWFEQWLSKVSQWPILNSNTYVLGACVIFVPLVILGVALVVLPKVLVFILSVVVLLYALGRGEFGEEVVEYNTACGEADWQASATSAQRQGVSVDGLQEGDWPALHEKMLEAVAYQGFERLFAVIFWFVFLGPLGAFLYRLSYLWRFQMPQNSVAQHWLWALEWAPARLLGVSFAVTGNFVGCINRWRQFFLCPASSASWVLMQSVLGALSVDDELVQSCDVTQREVNALKRLYQRTLWFWLAAIALWVIFAS